MFVDDVLKHVSDEESDVDMTFGKPKLVSIFVEIIGVKISEKVLPILDLFIECLAEFFAVGRCFRDERMLRGVWC